MDPWKYFSEGKSVLLSEELDFPVVDGLVRCKNKVMGCEIKPFLNSENYPLVSNTEALERLELMKLGLYNTVRKSCSSELNGEVFNDEIGSRISGDVREMNGLDYGLIDLKLGSQVHKEGEPVPSLSSSSPAKRPRTTSLHSRITFCQVHGCNKDLSSSKDYHKRHKVCDAHTKTAKVIVNGVEQRFCQQCSRFHLLAEFDDGKRSCRRRLADHNKRRRKPQIAAQSGAKFMSSSLLKGSPFSPEVLPSVILTPTKHTKFEDSFTYSNPTLNMKTLGGRMNNISSGFCDNMVSYVNPRIQHLSSVLDPSCALSLLSAQSQNTSNSRTDKMGPTSIVLSPERDLTNANYSLYHGHGTMVDLLQLSSNLQRIEQQRNNSPAQNDAR